MRADTIFAAAIDTPRCRHAADAAMPLLRHTAAPLRYAADAADAYATMLMLRRLRRLMHISYFLLCRAMLPAMLMLLPIFFCFHFDYYFRCCAMLCRPHMLYTSAIRYVAADAY